MIVGRKGELHQFKRLYNSDDSEFLAVYGRRRVGKTYLITEFFKDKGIFFSLSGQKNSSLAVQLANFSKSLQKAFGFPLLLHTPTSWGEAFQMLEGAISKCDKNKKIVLFFDELPWLVTKRSNCLSSLEYFWNTFAVQDKRIKLIVCGSAASWMINNIIKSKGGLHNRITAKTRLMPFSLAETRDYLSFRNIELGEEEILELYMAIGGIPHYLRQVRKDLSIAQNLNELCFTKDGFLSQEFDLLFDSLFDNSRGYKTIVRELAKVRSGLTRNELWQATKISANGTFSRMLKNLEESGFISVHLSVGKKSKGKIFRLSDPYSWFYLHWIKKTPTTSLNDLTSNHWVSQANTSKWATWKGYAFETICFNHIANIKKALGISGIASLVNSWRYSEQGKSSREARGTQIDMVIIRADKTISLCEIKCHNQPYHIDKRAAESLEAKMKIFREVNNIKLPIFTSIISVNGCVQNSYYQKLVHSEVLLEDLFV